MRFTLRGTGLRRYTRQCLVHDRDAARAEILRLEGVLQGRDRDVLERDQMIEQLRADAVDVGVERQLRAAAEQWAADVQRKYLALKAVSDNAHAITVPRWQQPHGPDETATEPAGIDVHGLRADLAATP